VLELVLMCSAQAELGELAGDDLIGAQLPFEDAA
jgi:hypothetical protein